MQCTYLLSEVIRDSHSGEPLQLAVQQQNNFAVGRKIAGKTLTVSLKKTLTVNNFSYLQGHFGLTVGSKMAKTLTISCKSCHAIETLL